MDDELKEEIESERYESILGRRLLEYDAAPAVWEALEKDPYFQKQIGKLSNYEESTDGKRIALRRLAHLLHGAAVQDLANGSGFKKQSAQARYQRILNFVADAFVREVQAFQTPPFPEDQGLQIIADATHFELRVGLNYYRARLSVNWEDMREAWNEANPGDCVGNARALQRIFLRAVKAQGQPSAMADWLFSELSKYVKFPPHPGGLRVTDIQLVLCSPLDLSDAEKRELAEMQ